MNERPNSAFDEESGARSGDLVLAQGEYALVQDGTNGSVQVVVGPHKISIAGTDVPVEYDPTTRRFVKTQKMKAVKQSINAREGQYVVLTNPAALSSENEKIPYPTKGVHSAIPLNNGRKVNIPGPTTFALYPGQYAEVIDGHQLRSNQYLVVRVYNEDEAKKNWNTAVVKKADGENKDAKAALKTVAGDTSKLTIGKMLIIKGIDVSFYIPPTGIEVVPDEEGKMVRDALTLQRLTYCILLSEDGEKTYVRGPAVVFPEPTQTIVTQDKSPKYKAIELNEAMGLYIKVIADYEEGGKKYIAGDELFITGAEQRIYFPRSEHALIRYGEDIIHFAIAIPKGEARYVLQKDTGEVKLVKGPKMFLPDPRKEVIVRRILEPKVCELWYPGNEEAKKQNIKYIEEMSLSEGSADMNERVLATTLEKSARDLYGSSLSQMERKASDHVTRARNFTPPRTITLNTKYDGAVAVNVWTGYAVQIVNKNGDRKVVQGPNTVLLEYDETLEVIKLSRGVPKSSKEQLRTVYLRVTNNKITDLVEAETEDLVTVGMKISYTVNFEGSPDKWYNVEDYVKFLADQTRSIIRNTVKHMGIEKFSSDAINTVRDVILGKNVDGKGRPGRPFPENGMRICDLDILNIQIGDATIGQLLKGAQHSAVKETLQLQAENRRLDVTKQVETIKQQIADFGAATEKKMLAINQERAALEARIFQDKLVLELGNQEILDGISKAKLIRKQANDNQKLEALKQELQLEAEAYTKKFAAVTPGLVEAITGLGDKMLAADLARNLPAAEGSLGLLLGMNGIDQLRTMVAGTSMERAIDNMKVKNLAKARKTEEITE